MTTDIELLPLPEEEWNVPYGYDGDAMHAYARANMAPLKAEIEALRAEVAEWKRVAAAQAELHFEAEERAERLAEAKNAEIETLKVEVAAQRTRADAMAGEAIKHEARAERLERGLRYAVRVWVLSDEIAWSEAEIDKAVERIIGASKKEAGRG